MPETKVVQIFFRRHFVTPLTKNALMKIMCEKSTKFQYLYEYIGYLYFLMKVNHIKMIEFNHI